MTDKIGAISIRDSSGSVQTVDTMNGGLNIYQIIPKVKQYVMSGKRSFIAAYIHLAGEGYLSQTEKTIKDVSWGMSVRTNRNLFYVGGFLNSPMTLYYDYIAAGTRYDYEDVSKQYFDNERTSQITLNISGGTFNAATPISPAYSIVGINDVRLSRRLVPPESINIVNIRDTSNNIIQYTSSGDYFNSVITCPNNAIMFVSNITATFTTAFSGTVVDICLAKYEGLTGVRTTIYRQNLYNKSHHFTAGYGGSLGGYMYPGDAVLMFTTSNNLGVLTAYSNVVIKYLS